MGVVGIRIVGVEGVRELRMAAEAGILEGVGEVRLMLAVQLKVVAVGLPPPSPRRRM